MADSEPSNDFATSAAHITRCRSTMRMHSQQSHEKQTLENVFIETLNLTVSEMERRSKKCSTVLLALDSVYEFEISSIKPLEAVGIKIPEKKIRKC